MKPPPARITHRFSDARPAGVRSIAGLALAACGPLLALAADAVETPPPAMGARPNIIFILTDDQGWGDAGFAGHPYAKTPHLDRFAAQATWFRQFYAPASVCSPSRCGFMTGQWPARHRIHGHFATPELNAARSMPDWLDPSVPTVTALLREAGYVTAHIGKWHLGHGPDSPELSAYGIDHARHVLGRNEFWPRKSTEPHAAARTTAKFVVEAIAVIHDHQDRPFYMNLWTLLPHAPLDPTPEQVADYRDLRPDPANPAFAGWTEAYLAAAQDLPGQMRIYCAALTDIDTQLGRLFDALDRLGLSENTLILLASDNGPEDYRVANAANAGVGVSGPLRGRKRSLFEGGIRTFGLARWPGKIAAGKRDEHSVLCGVDWLPTVCRIAGVDLPPDLRLDGEDVTDILLGATRPRRKPLLWQWTGRVAGDAEYKSPSLGVRDGNWKLFVDPQGRNAELYDIPADPGEHTNRAADHPEVVKRLTATVLDWKQTLPIDPR
jgi:N-acetylgalactosamine-6-sulfatase